MLISISSRRCMSREEELFEAVGWGNKHRVEELLVGGADIRACQEQGFSLLHCAASTTAENRPDVLAIATTLIGRRGDINAKMKWGETPLHLAAENGNADVARLLIENGAHLDAENRGDRFTPLHLAVLKGHKEVVEVLLQEGARIDLASRSFGTPLQIAEEKGHREIAALLKAHAMPKTSPEETKSFVSSEAERKAGPAQPPERTVEEVMDLVRFHRDDDARLESALAHYFGARGRPAQQAHPRINPAGGFSVEHD
jgi:hypothetical protein